MFNYDSYGSDYYFEEEAYRREYFSGMAEDARIMAEAEEEIAEIEASEYEAFMAVFVGPPAPKPKNLYDYYTVDVNEDIPF